MREPQNKKLYTRAETAFGEFLKADNRFTVDQKLSGKLLITCILGGDLQCIRG